MTESSTSLGCRRWAPLARSIVVTVALSAAIASPDFARGSTGVESRDAGATADAFADAIGRGDRAAARELLLPGVLIFESGDAEQSADEYTEHHLPADIIFMAGMKREVQSRQVGGDQTTSWVATETRLRGHYKGKALDLNSTETLVLTRTSAGWRIAHAHWSSSPHRSVPRI